MSEPADQKPASPARLAIMYAILLGATLLIYLPAMRFSFVSWDDDDLVLQNPPLLSPTWEHLRQFWIAPYAKLYTPVSYTAWWLLAKFSRGSLGSAAFHGLNIYLHVAAAVLVFSILRKCAMPDWPALIGALIFALHPIQVEAVAWVSGMSSLLAAVFSLAAIRLYLQYSNPPSSSRGWWYAGATLLFLLALLAKPSAVVVPFIAAVIDLAAMRRKPGRVAIALFPWLVASAAMIFITRHAQPVSNLPHIPLWQRPAIAADALLFYLGKIVWPVRLTIDYARTPAAVLSTRHWIIAALMLLVLAAALWNTRRRYGGLIAGLAILFFALLPTLGLAAFDFQRYSTVADRYVYLGMAGVAWAIAWVIAQWKSPLLMAIVSIAIVPLAWCTAIQVRHWRSTEELVDYTLQLDPESTIGCKIEAEELARQSQWEPAIQYYDIALLRNPNDGDLHYNLANALLADNDVNDAIDEYEAAIPRLDASLRLRAMNNLGIAYFRVGQTELAESEFMSVLEIDPRNVDARKNLALVALGVPSE